MTNVYNLQGTTNRCSYSYDVYEYEPTCRTITVTEYYDDYHDEYYIHHTYFVSLPRTLLVVNKKPSERRLQDGWSHITPLFINAPIEEQKEQTEILFTPFLNFYGQHGVCFGHNLIDKPVNVILNDFWNIPFAPSDGYNDNTIGGAVIRKLTPYHLRKRSGIIFPFYKQWAAETKKDRHFGEKVPWPTAASPPPWAI